MLDDRITEACHRIEELYYETGGKCYASFSGGKDSTVLLALIKMCEEIYTIPEGGIPAVYCNTGIELGVTVDFVNWVKDSGWYSNVQIIRPEHSFDWVLKTKGKPMKSKLKSQYLRSWHAGNRGEAIFRHMIYGITKNGERTWRLKMSDKDMHMLHDEFNIKISESCCSDLKKKPFKRYIKENGSRGQATGIRGNEGGARELNLHARLYENATAKPCTTIDKQGFVKKAPLIDWTDENINEFIEKYNVPLSDAYTKYGFRRTGCMRCPFSLQMTNDLKYLYDFEPNRYKAAMHWLKDVYIAQNVVLPFDEDYERERERTWHEKYEPMRQEMLRKYRPNSRLIKDGDQLSIFDMEE